MKADAAPLVSVLLPFHDASETMADCIESILAQSMGEFEVIAVNDFSNDDSLRVLQSYNDDRIKIIENQDRGLVSALNTGLDYCTAPLVARMDADDIMYSNRLAKQHDYMRQHDDVVLVAAQARKFPQASIRNGYREYMRWQNSVLSAEDISKPVSYTHLRAHET